MSEQENASGVAILCISSLDLSVYYTQECSGAWVAWLSFQASDGSNAALNLHALAENKGPIARNAILQWCEDHQPNSGLDRPAASAGTVGGVVVPLHSCTASARVTKCDNVTDEWTCSVCGKTWTRPCNFDDDYS